MFVDANFVSHFATPLCESTGSSLTSILTHLFKSLYYITDQTWPVSASFSSFSLVSPSHAPSSKHLEVEAQLP